MSKQILIYSLLLSFAGMVQAQNDSLEQVLSEVVISENRLSLPWAEQSRSIIVIEQEQIETAPVRSVNGLLQHYAAIDIRQRGPNGVQADAGIRGSTFDQVLILLNGIRISDLQTGHHSLNLPVDIENIERIEVLKGPGARVFGQNAFAGAINIITKSPEETFLKVQATGGENGTWGGKYSGAVQTGRINHYLSVTRDESDGYKYNTDYEISNYFYQADIQAGRGEIQVLGGFSERKFGANGFYASPDFMDQYEEVQTSLVSTKYGRAIGNRIFFKTSAYWRRNRDEYIFVRQDPSIYRNLHFNHNLGADANMSLHSNMGVTGIGVDANHLWLESNNLGERNRTTATLFLEHRFSFLNGQLNLTPGVQFNHYSDFGFNALPGVDVGYALSETMGLFANWGRTYRVPTYTDLYYSDPANNGNPDLAPEYANTYEVGIKTRRTRQLTGQLSYFYRDGNNIIDWTKTASEEPWTPNNLIGVEAQGVDGNLSFTPSDNTNFVLRIDIGYTYVDASTVDTDSNFSRYALENLQHQINGGVVLRYGSAFTHSIRFRYCNRVNLDDYSLVDSRLGFRWKNLNLFAEATNIFAVEYKETNLVTMPGRWISGGISYTILKK